MMRRPMLWCVVASLVLCGCNGRGETADSGTPVDETSPVAQTIADSLLPRLQRLSGLTAREPVKIRSQNRAAVRAYVEGRLNEELPPEKLAGLHDTYALLGLIPDTIDLRALLLDLYTEQVVGYYDPAARTMYVLSGSTRAEMRSVLAHELVHALQDQHVKVDSLINADRGNDRQTAAHAALEGHATIVMFALLAEDAAGQEIDPALLPNPAEQLRAGLDPANSPYPVFARAPAVVRETLLFPYIGGADFLHTVWSSDPTRAHKAPIGMDLPQSTEQLLHTAEKFVMQRDTPTEVRFVDDAPGYTIRREDTLGELETGILIEHYLGAAGRASARGWDGDRYRLLQRTDGSRVFVWETVWDDAASADAFAHAMRQVSDRRTERTMQVERKLLDGRAAVRVVDVPAGSTVPALAPARITQ